MQTNLTDLIKNSSDGQEAEAIIRNCVHCGFCLSACPTYQLLGDELDSPRGRIYLIKQVLEGQPVTDKTQLHLDRCLTCLACETVCPSGVRYGRLLDIGRNIVEEQVGRKLIASTKRYTLRQVLSKTSTLKLLLKLGRFLRPLLPKKLKNSVPSKIKNAGAWPSEKHTRKMLILNGCVQSVLAPNINSATARVLDRFGISLIQAENESCCGAVSYHLGAQQEGLGYMRRNVDAWWPYIKNETEQKVEAIIITASGCGVTVKEYGHLLKHDPVYAEKAACISGMARDISEIINAENNMALILYNKPTPGNKKTRLSFHSPCTLQHGLQINGIVEKIMAAADFDLIVPQDSHLCCGAAGTYSILQPQLSQQLLRNKIVALESDDLSQIVTANIGCLIHLRGVAAVPVKHWIEMLDEKLHHSINV